MKNAVSQLRGGAHEVLQNILLAYALQGDEG